ncbi:hypothetical protein GCM10011571_33670 [Marinithermofilum abyssi]|uniref:Uncharacterized protein n=1 Tax=Marinithermofilum abyssi TaxID=1571185 RepID=A0A8J2VFS9_9BACL|nr:hypothetical protein [Marinithermofilum abyssi]GGE28806.1 hypothetical protein GCM10011571_33670 [Marinithermofilum abyssi]
MGKESAEVFWKAQWKKQSEVFQQVYHELLNIATHMDDRPQIQQRIWAAAKRLRDQSL